MRPGPDDATARGNLNRRVRVSSWLGATLLAEDVPVHSATFGEDDGQQIPEKVELTVPVWGPGGSWEPGADTLHPLARFGQRLFVTQVVTDPYGHTWDIDLGWFQIQSWDVDDDLVKVTATGLLQVVADDAFRGPEQPRTGGTFASEFRRLTSGGIPVSISTTLQDRACPGGFTWDEDRLAALYDLADAWPARISVNAEGTLEVLPPISPTHSPVLTLTDGQDGVLMSAPRGDDREGVYTAVVARSSADDAESRPVEAEYLTTSGPYSTETYGVVRRRYASPLLGTTAAALAAARTIAETSQRQGRTIMVTMPPDLRIQRGDPVTLVWDEQPFHGWVTAVNMPLTVQGGAGTVTVGVPL